MIQHEARVQEHPHRHEEDAQENVLEGEDVRENAQAVARVADHDSCNKRAQGQGEAGRVAHPGRTQHQKQYQEQKKLSTAGGRGLAEDGRQHEAAGQDGCNQEGRRLARGHGERNDEAALRVREDGKHDHHRDQGQVLQQQNAQADAAVKCIDFAGFLQKLQHDGRAAEGHQATEVDALIQRPVQKAGRKDPQDNDQADLEASASQCDRTDPSDAIEGQLDTQVEQEKNDSEFGDELEFAVRDEVQPVRAYEHAREDIPDKGRLAQTGNEQAQDQT